MTNKDYRKMMQDAVPEMQYIGENTQTAEYIRTSSRWAIKQGLYTLWDAYKNPSVYKERAYNYCRELSAKYNGYNFRICGHGCQTFSVTFNFNHPETGEICTAWITRDNNRFTTGS